MTENQKLREAEQALLKRYAELVNSGDAGNWYQEAELEVIAARQALALPTAAPVGELPELPEPYRALDKHLSHPILRQVLFAPGEYFTADQMRAYARATQAAHNEITRLRAENAALQSGADAVDAQRYRWLREQNDDDFSFAVVKNPHFDVYESPEELDAAIDAAMRKDKP